MTRVFGPGGPAIGVLGPDRDVPEPDVIVSKEQASEIIEALKAGTYNADAYTVPF